MTVRIEIPMSPWLPTQVIIQVSRAVSAVLLAHRYALAASLVLSTRSAKKISIALLLHKKAERLQP